MTNHPRDLVAVAHQALVFQEAALKQIAVLFNRIAVPGLSTFLTHPNAAILEFSKFGAWLAEIGILFEPDIEKSAVGQDLKNRMRQDINELYKPVGLTLDDFSAAREDEKKAAVLKNKMRELTPTRLAGLIDPFTTISAIQRMTLDLTRLSAIQLRNIHNLDAHAIVPSEFSSLDQDDESTNKHNVVKIVVTALPVPHPDVSWQQIIEYRNDPNSLNRFLDLRNWISDTVHGRFTPLEVEQNLRQVLKRFRKQMEFHRMQAEITILEAFVVAAPDLTRSYAGYPTLPGLCSVQRMKLALLEGESVVEGSEVAFVIKTKSVLDA